MFKGSITALVTPFSDNSMDERAYRDLIAWQIAEGTHAIVPAGTTGESPTLSNDEHQRVIEIAVEECKDKVPVIAGAGSNSTEEAIHYTRYARNIGADAALIVTPYYNKPTQEGLYLHFKAVADAADGMPIIIYNIPGRCIVDMSVETMSRLVNDCPNIVGLKDATGDLARPLNTRVAIGPDFAQLSGEDATAVAYLAQGGVGCISVTSNVAPGLCADMQNAWARGEYETCFRLRDTLAPLHAVLFCETSPAPVKYALELMGKCPAATRLPLAPLSEGARQKVRAVLSTMGLI